MNLMLKVVRKIGFVVGLFMAFTAIGFTYFYIQYQHNKIEPPAAPVADARFISIKNKSFYLEGNPWYLKAVNFVTTLRKDDHSFWPSVYMGYIPEQEYYQTNKDSCLAELLNTFVLIHDLGYNAIRITGIGEFEVQNKNTGKVAFRANYYTSVDQRFKMEGDSVMNLYFEAVDELLKCAEKAGLKVILTLKVFPEAPITELFLKEISNRFKENTTLMAYDFFNEPLYFDDKQRSKNDVYVISRRWNNIVKKYAPHQLTTIGLACQREVFEWDPNIVNVDFISFHPYEYEKDQVRSEMYWYNKYVNKPWIIGETGIPSNNDSIPYTDQVNFAEKTINQNLNCGSMGYSWWQYKDVEWGGYHQNYLGVVSQNGFTLNSRGRLMHGTPKPVNEVVKNFNPQQKKEACMCPENYYNFSSNTYFRIVGKVVDDDNKPIDGAGVLAWDEWWINHYFTTTKPDGTFEIFSNYDFYHWMISPTNFNMIRGDIKPDTARMVNGIKTINLGELDFKKLHLTSWYSKL